MKSLSFLFAFIFVGNIALAQYPSGQVLVDDYVDNLQELKAVKLDWGRNEKNKHIPVTCRILSQKLENLGIEHLAEEYIGVGGHYKKHRSQICTPNF